MPVRLRGDRGREHGTKTATTSFVRALHAVGKGSQRSHDRSELVNQKKRIGKGPKRNGSPDRYL